MFCIFFRRSACLEPKNSEEKQMAIFYKFKDFVFVVVCICLLVCWYLLFEQELWKPGDPEENHFDPGGEKYDVCKQDESNILERTRL